MNDTATERSRMETARLEKGWTQRKLADVIRAAGTPVTDSHLSKIERGRVSPGPALRRAIADALNLSINDLP
jgi:transcriptional regulator with XRE-family HTH domain